MSTNVGKKNIAHKGSSHGAVAPGAISLVSPPAPPAPTPFVYTARTVNASGTEPRIKVGQHEVLVEGSTMSLDPPANQPAQSGGGDVVTHATKSIATMVTGSVFLSAGGKGLCATGDIASMNVLNKNMRTAQMQVPLLEGADLDTARGSYVKAAEINRIYRRAYPPAKANQCRGGHPVDLGTGYVVDDAVDLTLPGFLPLVWSRSYSSANPSHRGALGKGGWTHSFEQWIEPTESGFLFHDEEGLPVQFGPIGEKGFSLHRGKRLELRARKNCFEIRSLRDRFIRTFGRLPGGRIALRSIRDARSHQIQLDYEGDVLVRIVDSVKREIRLESDGKGRVTRVEVWANHPGSGHTPALQSWFDYAYHMEGELASHTNAIGHAEGWEYDGIHRMVKATLRNGVSFHYEYDPAKGHCVRTWGDGGIHDVSIEIDFEKGETRTHGTNRARRYLWKNGVVFREATYGGEWTTERIRDDDEMLVAVRNGAGEATTYEYDARGNLIRETDPAGNVSTWEYEDDLPMRHVGPTGLETRYTHDSHGSLVEVKYPTGQSYHCELDREGRISSFYNEYGSRAKLGYDEHTNVVTDTSARGATTSYRYDALGRPVERTDAIGRTIRVQYDRMGRVVEIVHPDGTRVCATYDRLGKLASASDALGCVTRLEHAGTGHLARLTQADGRSYRFLYDSDERLIGILNSRLERYEFEYDRADRIVVERTFDGRTLSYRYDRAGRVMRIEHPEGEWREFSHDKVGNVVEDRGADLQLLFTWDALGRVEKAICQDVTGKVVTELERDGFGRLTADIQNGRAVRYEYDERGRRAARILPDGERTVYHYDDVDDAFAGVTHQGRRVSIERDALGRERTRHTKGWRLDCEYDPMDRLLSQKVTAAEPGGRVHRLLSERRYAYDTQGRLASIDSHFDGLSSYRYDGIDQLIEVSRGTAREIFEYDPTGSLTNVLHDLNELGRKAAWSFLPGGQLKATTCATYVNDGRGRRIQRIDRADVKEGRVTTYGWDSKDRLREMVMPDGVRVRFTYDAFGRRTRKDVLPSLEASAPPDVHAAKKAEIQKSVLFLWDGDVLCEEQDSSKDESARKRVHVHEPGTFVPMLQEEQGQVFGVVNEHRGMPKELVDESGRIAWRARHGAWGSVVEVVRETGASTVESPFRLMGQYADDETGLCSTKFRYFDPETARWASPDPLGVAGGTNLFAFGGSPTIHSDPLGLCSNPGTVSLVPTNPDRRAHILNRHRHGANKPKRTEFPSEWSDDQIIHAVSDVASDPNSARGIDTANYNTPFTIGVRDGIVIRVDFYPDTNPNGTPHTHAGKISTAYPTNTPQNP